MNIRKYQGQDRDSLIELWESVFPEDPPHNKPGNIIDAKLEVDDLIIVAEDSNIIIGACIAGYDGHRGWLYAVAVLPEFRIKGTGKLLVQAALNSLKDLGCIKVNLQIRPTNETVVAFYKSLGFAVEDRVSMGVLINQNS